MSASEWTAPEAGWFTLDPAGGWRKTTAQEIAMRTGDWPVPGRVTMTFETMPGVSAEELEALKAQIIEVAVECLIADDAPGGPPRDYFAEHGEDMIEVRLIDLVSVVARMRQVRDNGAEAEPVVFGRIFTCDLPRLEGYLPAEALREMDR